MKVSIVMAAYNAEKDIEECINSIMLQTYPHFEVIIINDGSTDRTSEILSKINDERFRIINSDHDYIASLNKGLKLARGKYIARMDADDIMVPTRIEKELNFMEENPDIDVCSACFEIFGSYTVKEPIGSCDLSEPLVELLTRNMICHPATMLRKSFLENNNIHYKRYDYAEDYKFWVDIACAGGRFHILPDVLIKHRRSPYQVSRVYSGVQRETASRVQNEILYKLLNDSKYIGNHEIRIVYKSLENLNLQKLLSANTIRKIIRELYVESIRNTNHEVPAFCAN